MIGNFDGLHLGHQKLFKLAKNFKKKYSIKIGVLTFEPMPKMFFDHKLKNFRISNQKQKINLLKSFNVDFVIVKKFDRSFSKTKWCRGTRIRKVTKCGFNPFRLIDARYERDRSSRKN